MPSASDVVVMESGGGLFIIKDRAVESVLEPSFTWTVKLKVPVAVGVPEISPVEGVSESPAGSEPMGIDQV